MKRALIIKIGAIGDAVMALPLARELSSQGYSEITWMGGSAIAPVLASAPELTEQIIVDERALFQGSRLGAVFEVLKTWWHLRHLRGREVFLLHADRRYKLLIPPWLRRSVRTVRVGTRRHHTFEYARLAYPHLEDNALEFAPYTLAPSGERTRRICIFPGGAKNVMRDNPLRRWPINHYVQLSEVLLGQGYHLSILGGPSDQWVEPYFAHLRTRVDWQVGRLQLNETIEFLRSSTLAVSHDTGPVHLASLADCPIITIFGPTNSEWFAPIKYKDLVLERTPKLPCQPCYDGKEFGFCTKNICIQSITPSSVAEKVAATLPMG